MKKLLASHIFLGIIFLSLVCLAFGREKFVRPDPSYDESKVPTYTLPDPLVMENGEPVKNAAMWIEKRRPEILGLFEKHVYGRMMAGRPEKMTWKVTSEDPNVMNGKAISKTVMLYFDGREDGPSMQMDMTLPKTDKPVPVFMLAQWGKAMPEVLDRGYGMIICRETQIQPDKWDTYSESIRAFFAPPGQTEAKPDEWGAIGVWAWGLSRAMDYVETDRDIDAKRVCLQGFSRFGKTVMWAGARDQRFAMTFSGDSGCGGAALVRREFGETVYMITGARPYWFCGNFKTYGKRVNELPVDWHELIALYAPRPVYIATADEDLWGDPYGSFLAAKAADPVYKLFGKTGLGVDAQPPVDTPVGDFIGYHNRKGKHDQNAYDWQQYLNFADRHLKKDL